MGTEIIKNCVTEDETAGDVSHKILTFSPHL